MDLALFDFDGTITTQRTTQISYASSPPRLARPRLAWLSAR
jgi:hypothetical protein